MPEVEKKPKVKRDRTAKKADKKEAPKDDAAPAAEAPKEAAPPAGAERAAEAAAKFLDAPCETPILLEGMHALRSTHPHLPRGGGVATAMAADKPFAAP